MFLRFFRAAKNFRPLAKSKNSISAKRDALAARDEGNLGGRCGGTPPLEGGGAQQRARQGEGFPPLH